MNRRILQVEVLANLHQAEAEEQQERQVFKKTDPFRTLTDNLFMKHFRLSKDLANDLIQRLDEFLTAPSRISAIDKQTKVLIALNFFATGSYQSSVGSNVHCGGVSQATVSRCVMEVVDALNNEQIFNQWVKFPRTLAELNGIRRKFFQAYNIPGIVGVIDCTHVAIVPPTANDELYPEHIYVNRKNYHSINVQLICDTDLKIINVNARFAGSTHDSHIWNTSVVKQQIMNLNRIHPDYYLIGDSGYALRPWLHTPVRDALPGTPEYAYNESFKQARSIIERCNGVLKMRFRCLLKHRVLHYSPSRSSKIINACVVLHNICQENNIPPPGREDGDEHIDFGMYNIVIDDNPVRQDPDLVAGRRYQQQIINNYFRNH